MATHVERSIEVEVPVRTAYDQWTQFEEFPRFMQGVQEVRQIGDALTHWVAEIAGVRREWDAAILEQVPDRKVAWAAVTGATNAGAVYFDAVGENRTRVRLTLDYEPEGIVERVADVLDFVDRQAVADLDRFKEFIEQRGAATGGWRGVVDEGNVEVGSAGTGAAPRTADLTGAGTAGTVGAAGAAGAGAVGGAAAGAWGAGVAGATGPSTLGAAGGDSGGATATGDAVAPDATVVPGTGADAAAGVPGDVVAVGPTGGTHSTLDTESGPAQNPVLDPDEGRDAEPLVATDGAEIPIDGDPVAIDPALTTGGTDFPPGGNSEPGGAQADFLVTPDGTTIPVEGAPLAVDPAVTAGDADASPETAAHDTRGVAPGRGVDPEV